VARLLTLPRVAGRMHPESFFHVALKVPDLDEAEAFYLEHFGAEVIERGDAADGTGATAVNHVAMQVADKRLYCFDRAPYEAVGHVEDVPVGFLHFGFVVEDVAAASEELAADGVAFVMEPTDFSDLRIAFVRDPAGNIVELIEHR